jgi:phosphate butyryltransferase
VIRNFAALLERARQLGPKTVAVVAADDEVALTAASSSLSMRIAVPVLIGDAKNIRAKAESLGLADLAAKGKFVASENPSRTAAQLAGEGKVDILLKGHLRTDEDHLAGEVRLVGVTDGGLNVAPNLDQKKQIVENAIEVMRCLGLARPKMAIMSATEAVSEAVPSTVDAKTLREMGSRGEFGEVDIFGPIALDCALLESAARSKNIVHPVAGHADCMVVPNIESGNVLGKAVKYLGGSQCAHVVAGAKVPVLIPSRVESAEDKLNAIALGVVFAVR